MAKVPVAVRLEPGTLERIDALAKTLKVSRQAVFEMFVASGLDDSERGVPDLPEGQDVEAVRVEAPKPRAISGVVRASSLVTTSHQGSWNRGSSHPLAMERQRKLNEAAARARLGVPKAKK